MTMAIKSRLRRISCALGALVCLTATHAGGSTTWHVRTDGSNNLCDGLTDAGEPGAGTTPRPCAFRTPQKGVDVAGRGDTVLVHAGTYSSPGDSVEGLTTIVGFDLRGEFDFEEDRLTLKAAGDGAVVFDGGNSLDAGVAIWGTSFLTIEGIEMRRFTADASFSFTYGAAGVNVGSPGPAAPSQYLVLRSLIVRNATDAHPDGSFAEIAIWGDDCTDNLIDSCRIESVEPAGIAVGSNSPVSIEQRGEIRDTTVLHVRDAQAWTGILGLRTNVWTVNGGYLAETAVPHVATDLLRARNSKNWAITNSVFHRPPRAAIHLLDDVVSGNLNEAHLVLNDTIDCAGSSGIGVRLERINATEVRNSIVTSCDSAVFITDDCTNSNLGFNDFFDNAIGYEATGIAFGHTLVGSDVSDDPLFERVAPRPDPFYRLADGSPAIDVGDNDNCAVVPADGLCDLGAFQASVAAGQPPETPVLASVDTITGRSAVLRGSAFSDPDPGDTHAASRWQVDLATGDFSSPVRDSGRTTEDLTSHRVSGLDAVTTYKSRVRYEDADGHVSAWSDPATDPGDEFTTLVATAIPPRVLSVDPPHGLPNVTVATTVTLTFNVPLLTSSVTPSTVKLVLNGVAIAQAGGSPSVQGDGSVVVLTPAGLLDPETKYKVAVVGGESGVASRDGAIPGKPFRSTFTTEVALASSNPANGDTDVSVGVTPQLVFKWNVNALSATTSTVLLKDVTAGKNVALASVGASGTTVTLTPAAPLKANHRHQIVVRAGTAGLRFADGRKLGKPVKVTFKTAAP